MKEIRYDYSITKSNYNETHFITKDENGLTSGLGYYLSYEKLICIYNGERDLYIVNEDYYNYSNTTLKHFWGIFPEDIKNILKKEFKKRKGCCLSVDCDEHGKYNFYFISDYEIKKSYL